MKQKCMTANAELFGMVVDLRADKKKLIRQQRAELHEAVGAMTSLEKELSVAKTSEVVLSKKLDKADKRNSVLTDRLETETQKRKLVEGELGRLVRGKGLLTKKGKAIAEVVREDADRAIKQQEQVSATKVCHHNCLVLNTCSVDAHSLYFSIPLPPGARPFFPPTLLQLVTHLHAMPHPGLPPNLVTQPCV